MLRNLIVIGFFVGVRAFGVEVELDLESSPLSCTRNIASSQNVWSVELDKELSHSSLEHSHRFSTTFLYADGAEPKACLLVQELNGRPVTAHLFATVKPYQDSICEAGGSSYCHRYGCYQYRVEYAALEFSNGLRLKSEIYHRIRRLHEGYCSGNPSVANERPVSVPPFHRSSPECAFYPELCISVSSCQEVGKYCNPSAKNCCPGLKCVPSGSALVGAHKCYP